MARGAANATIVARRATSSESALSSKPKAEKEVTKEAARAQEKRKAAAREKDFKVTATHAVSRATLPAIAGKAKGKVDMARPVEKEASEHSKISGQDKCNR